MNGTLLITGGAGFIGSNLAISFKKNDPDLKIIVLDNLKRRGSELNLQRLKSVGIEFVHGDIRNKEDMQFDDREISLIVECSAEPSILAGFNHSPEYLVNSNLFGAINCLEIARKQKADFIFLSTSRVYPVEKMNALNFVEESTRFALLPDQPFAGASQNGIAEDFPLEGVRSLYGATKLAAELIAQEYADMYGFRTIINRCGVVAGPWQMGKIDQGVFTLWIAAHHFNKNLHYIGFGGTGKQVRDVLHIDDLFDLIQLQIQDLQKYNGKIYNVGGGLLNSLSLVETTQLCQEISGQEITIGNTVENRPADIKSYITDNEKIIQDSGWKPKRNAEQTLCDIWNWIRDNESQLKGILN